MSLLFPKGGKAPNFGRFGDGCCVLTCFLPNKTWRYPPGPSQDRINIWLVCGQVTMWWGRLPSRFWNHCMLDTKQTIRLSSWEGIKMSPEDSRRTLPIFLTGSFLCLIIQPFIDVYSKPTERYQVCFLFKPNEGEVHHPKTSTWLSLIECDASSFQRLMYNWITV